MKRRSAIFIILMGSLSAGILTYTGINFHKLNRKNNLLKLSNYEKMLAELVNLILPRTNTPGAEDAQVHLFIILMVEE
ncbi:MAG: gluconate 2-dehydrogenase subunit 3 family protein, partial [Flavobacteriales bacterium]|nr:gluconate 2-dehydrogenase subunit 3 family protein [Flavobacteriales bacterium]